MFLPELSYEINKFMMANNPVSCFISSLASSSFNYKKDNIKFSLFEPFILNGDSKWLKIGFPIKNQMLNYALLSGVLKNIKWLIKNGCNCSDISLFAAVVSGNLKTVKWLIDNGCEGKSNDTWWCSTNYIIYYIYKSNMNKCTVKYLKKLISMGVCVDYFVQFASINVIKNEQLNDIEWILENTHTYDEKQYFYKEAIINNKIKIIKFLRTKGFAYEYRNEDDDDGEYNLAVQYGSFETLKWFKKHGYLPDPKTFEIAIKSNNYKIIKWLVKNNCEITSNCLVIASRNKNLKIIKLIKKNKSKIIRNIDSIDNAVLNEDINIIKWLIKNKYQMSNNTTFTAIKIGNLNILKLLVRNKCPLIPNSVELAYMFKNIQVAQWLLEQNYN